MFQNYVPEGRAWHVDTHRVINGNSEHAVYTTSTVNVQSGSFTSFCETGWCPRSQENHILLQNLTPGSIHTKKKKNAWCEGCPTLKHILHRCDRFLWYTEVYVHVLQNMFWVFISETFKVHVSVLVRNLPRDRSHIHLDPGIMTAILLYWSLKTLYSLNWTLLCVLADCPAEDTNNSAFFG